MKSDTKKIKRLYAKAGKARWKGKKENEAK